MTVFAWDASNHDWSRGPMDLAAARTDGIVMFVHKCAEGDHFFADRYYQEAMNRARAAGMPAQGPYFVLHPGNIANQVDWLLSIVNAQTPWWREHPCWVWQIDAEKFPYMTRQPNVDEINSFGDLLCSRAGVPASRVLAYAPQWLYGNTLTGLRYRLWASAYGANPVEHYREAYPGDTSSRWAAYSGQSPLLLQYGSQLTIGRQPGADASAYRGTLDDLLTAFGGTDMPLSQADITAIKTAVNGGTGALTIDQAQQWLGDGVDGRIGQPTNRPSIKAVLDKLDGIQAASQPTQEQVDAAVLAAMKDPEVQDGIGKAIVTHLKVGAA